MNFNQIRLQSLIAGCLYFFCAVSQAAALTESTQKADAPVALAATSDALPLSKAPEVFYESDPKSWARVKRIVPPKYPEAMLKLGQGAVVDIEVLIGKIGFVSQIRSVTSNPNNLQLVEATRAVLQYWTFNVPRSEACVPIESVGDMQLIFEVVNGEGKISLIHRRNQDLDVTKVKSPKMLNRVAVSEVIQEGYPREARRAGAQAIVYALLTVDHMSGATLSVEITHMVTPTGYEKKFAEAVMPGLTAVKFSPFPSKTMPWRNCISVDYVLRGESRD